MRRRRAAQPPAREPVGGLDVVIYPARDAPGQWIAHERVRNVAQQADSPGRALRLLGELLEGREERPGARRRNLG